MFKHSIGFGLAISWLWLFYLQGPLLGPYSALWQVDPSEPFHWFLCASWLTFLFLAKGIKIRSMFDKKHVLIVCAAILSLCPLLTAVLPRIMGNWTAANPYTLVVLAAISGVCSSPFLTAWMQTFILYDLRKLGLSFAVAITISGLLTMAAGIVDSQWMLPTIILFPFASLFCLLSLIKLNPSQSQGEFPKTDAVNPFPAKLVSLIILFYLIGGTMFSIISLEPIFSNVFYLSNASYVAACLIAGAALYFKTNMDLQYLYRPVLPFLAIGFLLFSFHPVHFPMVSFLLLQGGLALFDMYTWLLFPYFARFSTRPAAVCAFGLFLTTASEFCGNLATPELTTMISGTLTGQGLALVGGALTVLSVLIFPNRKETFAGWQTILLPGKEAQSQATDCDPPSDLPEVPQSLWKLPLTERENEVLSLLLKGRNSRFISESLNISTNTVKFHTRNIYDKLTVNNRQELLTRCESLDLSES
ncbi:MAG: helix-turn-helix transcriptional regulator [Negativicutes bacterium]|nr:helix-turn-helix transcriptional regulator [Negativicutes bacterium]